MISDYYYYAELFETEKTISLISLFHYQCNPLKLTKAFSKVLERLNFI